MTKADEIRKAMDTARRAVEAATKASLEVFRGRLDVRTKADGTLVTRADMASERAILSVIRETFPDAAVLTEESGALAGQGGSRWIVDPLDGTIGFTRGGEFWGPLVAFERGGEVVAGAMALPALGETWWAARGVGCFRDRERVTIAGEDRWDRATLSVGEMRALLEPPHGQGVLELIRTARRVRCYGDVAGVRMVLRGEADLWLEAGVKVWDLAALQVLIEEAGGRFTDFAGRRSIEGGCAVAGCAGLHAHALRTLNG